MPLWKIRVNRTIRIYITCVAAAVAFFVVWLSCAAIFGMSQDVALALAALADVILLIPLSLWITSTSKSQPSPTADGPAQPGLAGNGSTPAPKRMLVGAIPNPADCFQHRAVADRLELVLGSNAGASVTILSGLGGVGKTQAAAALARNVWDARAVDVLIWINASSRESIISGYAQAWADLLNTEEDAAPGVAKRILNWLATTDRRWLVVLDDLSEPGHVDQWWPPASGNGWVVLTTRRRDAALQNHGQLVDVAVFTPEEAKAYLTDKFGHRPDRLAQAGRMAQDLAYLPLALAQAAAYITDRNIDCGEYRRRFADQRRRLSELLPEPGALPDEYPNPVAVTWLLSVEAANQLHPPGLAYPMLVLLSLLDSNGIPADVVASPATMDFLAHHRTQGAADRELPVLDADAARDAVACLSRLNLAVAGEHDAQRPTIRVHALVQRTTREQSTPDLVAQATVAAADALLDVWPDVQRDTQLSQILLANASALLGNAEDHLWHRGVHRLLFRFGHGLGEAGLVAAAVQHFEQLAVDIADRLEPSHVDALTARAGNAWWRGCAGDAAGAAATFEVLIPDFLRVLGPEHPETLTARSDLAWWRGQAGDAAGAAAAFQVLLADRLRVLGPDHPHTLANRSNLAQSLSSAGDAGGAADAFRMLLADSLRVQGADHPDTLATRGHLYWQQGEAGDQAGAVAAFEALLADDLRVLGPDHHDTLATRGDLAWWRGQAGDAAGAAAAFEVLLADRLRVLGADHPETLATRGNLAWWRGQAGDAAGAAAAFEVLLADRLRVLGADHPETLATRGNLAWWRGQAGDAAGAAAAFEVLLADRLRVLGADHPETLATRGDLAWWQGQAGDTTAAYTAFIDLLADSLRVLGPEHPDTLATRSNLAHWQGETSDAAGAAASFESLLADQVRSLGPYHPLVQTTRESLAEWRRRAGNQQSLRSSTTGVEHRADQV